MKYAKVIVNIEVSALEKPYTYQVPDHLTDLIDIGSLVKIPFGKSNRLIEGYVITLSDDIESGNFKIKKIASIVEGIGIESELISLAAFMSRRYIAPIQTALKTMLPTKQAVKNKTITYIHRNKSIEEIKKALLSLSDPRYIKRKQVLEYMIDHERTTYHILKNLLEISPQIIKTLEKHTFIKTEKKIVSRDPFVLGDYKKSHPNKLNHEQELALSTVLKSSSKCQSEVFLLHGKTGTGKTEVYMQIIEDVLKKEKSCIVLIPEIGLTPQTVSRFISRFGDQVGVMHSKLSNGEKYDQWTKAKAGQIKIMIGPRSAIFAPFQDLGAIIIDESHESTYKSDTNPKYHAREIAIKRGSTHKCPVILGTATPLIENYFKALKGDYKLLKLNHRFGNYNKDQAYIVDMRQVLASGNTDIISPSLDMAIKDALSKNEQIILFLNRRGHSNFISCRNCGHVIKCESCDMPYTYHSAVGRLICHHCGKSELKPNTCPSCGSRHIKTFGVGTQQVEMVLNHKYPGVRVGRMDFDTTSAKGGHEKILKAFKNHDYDILVGTQMIAKGHHFDQVTVVGVLAADMSLYVSDYRASERTFQLINQVIGRTGRGEKLGQSYIQTYSPEHQSIVNAKNDDYESFYNEEIQLRHLLAYPPYTTLMKLLVQGLDEEQVIGVVNKLKDDLQEASKHLKIQMIGPSPAGIRKIKNRFRYQLFFKSESYKAIQTLAFHINDIKSKHMSDTINHITVDINPSYT